MRTHETPPPPKKNTLLLRRRRHAESKCATCAAKLSRETVLHQIDLAYPTGPVGRSGPPPFASALTDSLRRETTVKAWCDSCQRYQRQVRCSVMLVMLVMVLG